MLAKKLALTFGVVFVIVGIVGIIGGLGITGPSGIFATNTLHDLVHLISGIVFLIVATKAPQNSSKALMTFGVVYALVAILGFISTGPNLLGIILINSADNYLHVVLALATFIAGYASRNSVTA